MEGPAIDADRFDIVLGEPEPEVSTLSPAEQFIRDAARREVERHRQEFAAE